MQLSRTYHSLRAKVDSPPPQPVATRQAGRGGKGKGKQKTPEELEAAAAAAEGVRRARAEQGLGCRVCGVVFSTVSSRILLLKHIQKTGHTTDPTRKTGLTTGLMFIPDNDCDHESRLGLDGRARKGSRKLPKIKSEQISDACDNGDSD